VRRIERESVWKACAKDIERERVLGGACARERSGECARARVYAMGESGRTCGRESEGERVLRIVRQSTCEEG